jgi:NAD(P)-dependent dehydrogenase (short-subunit alcohol dehydrogenase family)/acyl carrier protein
VVPDRGPVDLPTYAFQHQKYWPAVGVAAPRQYQIDWSPRPETSAATPAGSWLLLAEPGSRLELDAHVVPLDLVPGEDRTDLAKRLQSVGDVDGVLLALDPAAGQRVLTDLITVIQAHGTSGLTAPLWCLTRGAVSVDDTDRPVDPWQAAAWGLGRVAALEHPDRWGGLLDLPAEPGPIATAHLRTGEDQIAVRGGRAYGRRLRRAQPRAAAKPWQPAGTVLVTGGTGALGAHTARWLAKSGAEHLLLLSRRGEQADGVPELIAELTAAGPSVTVAACDVTDREALAAVLADVPADRPLTAVVHTAGVLETGPIDELTPEALGEALRTKTVAAEHLHELTAGLDLSAFVLYSSIAGVWGSGNQAVYAAANAFLDGLAARRRHSGLAATAIAWGAWDGGGMSEGPAAEWLSRRGVVPMTPATAVRALEDVTRDGPGALIVADIAWDRFVPGFTLSRPQPLITEIDDVAAVLSDEPEPGASGAAEALTGRLAGQSGAERQRILIDLVGHTAAEVLGYPGGEVVPPDRAFRDLGFDSLTAVDMRRALGAATGLSLPASLVFDHPTPEAVAAFLDERLGRDAVRADTPVLAQLDRLENALAGLGDGDALRPKVAVRLRGLLLKYGDSGAVDDSERLDDASDEELFAFIRTELGRS